MAVDLASLVRGLKVGDPIVLEGPAAPLPQYGPLTASTEAVWYANPPEVFVPVGGGPVILFPAGLSPDVLSTGILSSEEELSRIRRRFRSSFNPATPPDPPAVPIVSVTPNDRAGSCACAWMR